jgi:hypothetical protein
MNPNDRNAPSNQNRNDKKGKQANSNPQNRNEQGRTSGKEGSSSQKNQEREQPNRRVGGDQED